MRQIASDIRSQMVHGLVLTIFFLLGLVTLQAAPAATGKKSASGKKVPKESPAERTQEAQQKASQNSVSARPAAQAGENEESDPDLPAFLRGKIDKETYLKLRAEYIGRIRGIDLNNPPDPHIRMNAIRTMEQQEQRIYGNRSLSATHGTIAPFSPPSSTTWTELGPSPIPNGQTDPNLNPAGEVAVSGRVSAIAVHPTNPNIVYVGAAQGGVFRSLDGGATWTPLMDNALSLAVGAIAIAPSQPSTIYVGTGEGNFALDSFFGVGVYRIDNADTTPVLVGPLNKDGSSADIFTGRSISQILVHPTDPNTIFVSTTSGFSGLSGSPAAVLPPRGLYRSTNAAGPAGSVTFAKLTVAAVSDNRNITDIAMEPGNPNNLVAAVFGNAVPGGGGYYRSTNAAAADPTTVTFTQTLQLFAITMKFAINKVTSTVTVLAGSGDGGGATGTVRISTDGGATWGAPVAAATNYCDGQCFYDAVVALKPDDANTFFLGGGGDLPLQKTINGGSSFTTPSVSLHADTHAIVYAPSDFTVMYEGNDGGVWRSADGGNTWTTRNTPGFKATQFQSLALHPSDRNFMIGGTQDNGTPMMKPDGSWFRADFGDGGYSLVDQNAADTTNVVMYHTYFNQTGNLIGFARTETTPCATEGQWSFMGIYGGPVDPTVHCDGTTDSFNGISINDNVLFYAPIALGPGTPNTVYYGSDRLYRSANQGITAALVSQGPLSGGVPVSTVAISPQNDNVRIVGLANGKVFGTTTGSSTLTDITASIPAFYVARAVIDPNNQNTAYVTLDGYGVPAGQHVWKTTSLTGAPPLWTASGSGIPDVPVNSMVVDPLHSNFVFAATDIGVYFSGDGGTTWNPYGTGLPRVACFDIGIQNSNRVLRVATHGRGIWEIGLPPLASTTAVISSSNPSAFSTSVTFTATVSGPSGTPTGTITFKDGSTVLGSNTLSSGSTTFTTNALSVGSHSITAVYSGDPIFLTSTSSPLTQTVTGTTTLTADISVTVTHVPNNPVIPIGGRVAITVTVTNNDATNPAQVALTLSTVAGPLELDSVVPPGGDTCNPPSAGTIQCSIPVLAANTSVVFTVNVRPLFSDIRTLTAIASEASNTNDPVPANNTASDTIKVRFKPFRR